MNPRNGNTYAVVESRGSVPPVQETSRKEDLRSAPPRDEGRPGRDRDRDRDSGGIMTRLRVGRTEGLLHVTRVDEAGTGTRTGTVENNDSSKSRTDRGSCVCQKLTGPGNKMFYRV